MLSHTRNRQSRWIKVTEAFKDKAVAAKVKAEAELTTDLSLRTQTHSDRRHADEKCHVKRHKSLIRNANWTNKTMYSISIVTYNGIRTTLLYIIRIWYNTIISGLTSCISRCLSVALIWGLYRPSSEPIALRNVLKRFTRHTLHIIRFWHFRRLSLQKTQKTAFARLTQ